MAEYQLMPNDRSVIRTADQAQIPNHPDNIDWQEYERWLAAGGVPDPVPPKVVPTLDSFGGNNTKTAAQILGAS